jgi:S1-C subfamily serine protease
VAAPPPSRAATSDEDTSQTTRSGVGGAIGRMTMALKLRGGAGEAQPPSLGSLSLTGPRGERRDLPLGGVRDALIGREPPADLVLADAGVSRQHARIVRRGSGFELVDLGSRNGTLINGDPVRGRRMLEPGDEIEIGPYRLLARPPETGDTVVIKSRRRSHGRTPLLIVAAGSVLAAGAVAAGVALVVSRGGEKPAPTTIAATAAPSESQQLTEAVKRVRPSVVRIRTRTADGGGVGTGIIVADGLIVTNQHVIEGDNGPTITLADGREVKGQVLGFDAKVDLAVVKVDVTGLTAATWGDSEALQPGDRLAAIGYALGASAFTSGEPSVTSGIFSGKRDFQGQTYVQTDTPVNHGNSGGPLINIKGEVIGVNVLVIGRTAEQQAQGLNLAIPSSVAKALVPVLRDKGPQRSTPTAVASASAPLTYRSTKFNYSIQYPANWKIDESDPAEVEISGDGGYIVVAAVDLRRTMSLSEYTDAVIADLKKQLNAFTLNQRNTRKLKSGLTVEVLDITWEQNGKRIEGIEVVAVQGTRGYELVGAAESDKFGKVSGKVVDALNSFALR